MKFQKLNKKKLFIILLSSFIITNMSGCKNKDIAVNNSTNKTTEQDNTTQTIQNDTTEEQTETYENNYSTDDLIVINEFDNLNKYTDELVEDETTLDKLKSIFITAVDFIFFESEINGVKFDDLTNDGKQKILQIVANIDTKIEENFPNYKETISSYTKEAYTNASKLIKNGANNINEFAKDKLGEENYQSLIDAKDELINYTKEASDIILNFSSDLYNSGKEKIKNWYEEFRKN